MFEIDPPTDKQSIAAALEKLEREIGTYFKGLSVEAFLAPQGAAWSPCGHLEHLTKAVAPVAGAMRRPRWLLALMFLGANDRMAWSVEKVFCSMKVGRSFSSKNRRR